MLFSPQRPSFHPAPARRIHGIPSPFLQNKKGGDRKHSDRSTSTHASVLWYTCLRRDVTHRMGHHNVKTKKNIAAVKKQQLCRLNMGFPLFLLKSRHKPLDMKYKRISMHKRSPGLVLRNTSRKFVRKCGKKNPGAS